MRHLKLSDKYLELLETLPLHKLKELQEVYLLLNKKKLLNKEACTLALCGITTPIKLSEDDLNRIYNLSINNLKRFRRACLTLSKHNLLDTKSCTLALLRISTPVPIIPLSYTSLEKITTPLGERKKIKLNNHTIFYEESDCKEGSEFRGAQAKICKGYLEPEESSLHYAIKSFKVDDETYANVKNARREAKISHLLGRQTFRFYDYVIPLIVTPWLQDRALDQYEEEEITAVCYHDRLQWILSLLQDINQLHEHYRIHGDIKPANMILNIATQKLVLIDFGSTHKIDTHNPHRFHFAQGYSDLQTKSINRFAYDIYAMGLVIAHIFSDIFEIEYKRLKSEVKKTRFSKFSVVERAIVKLVGAMVERNPRERCTSEAALQFVSDILKHYQILNDQKFKEILEQTLNHANFTVEDILRKSKRPGKFSSSTTQ